MARQGLIASRRRNPGQSRPFVGLAGRLLVAQAGASAAIGLGFYRRNAPWLVLAILVAVALCGLARLVRSGTHATWLAAVSVESGLVAVGLFRFAYARYLGGTLLAIITLGTLLHPAVARAFAGAPQRHRAASDRQAAPGTSDALPGQALS